MSNRSIVFVFVAMNALAFAGYRAVASPRPFDAELEVPDEPAPAAVVTLPVAPIVEPIVVEQAPPVEVAPTVDLPVAPAPEETATAPETRTRKRDRGRSRDRASAKPAPESKSAAPARTEVSAPAASTPPAKKDEKKKSVLDEMESNPYKRTD
jgi:hypothetical protein